MNKEFRNSTLGARYLPPKLLKVLRKLCARSSDGTSDSPV